MKKSHPRKKNKTAEISSHICLHSPQSHYSHPMSYVPFFVWHTLSKICNHWQKQLSRYLKNLCPRVKCKKFFLRSPVEEWWVVGKKNRWMYTCLNICFAYFCSFIFCYSTTCYFSWVHSCMVYSMPHSILQNFNATVEENTFSRSWSRVI